MTPEEKTIKLAESVGWKLCGYGYSIVSGGEVPLFAAPHADAPCFAPNFFGDSNAALTLVDALAKEGWNCQLSNGLDTTWECEFYRPDYENSPKQHQGIIHGQESVIYYVSAETLPAAICEAYAAVKELW